MARVLWRGLVALSLLFLYFVRGSGRSVPVISGDSFTFQDTENCKAAKGTLIHRDRNQRVAFHTQGVWKPDDEYKNRIHSNSSVSFTRAVLTDAGTYELICDDSQEDEFKAIQLKVAVPHYASVTEGDAVKLKCSHNTVTTGVESVWWMKHGKLVFERNFSSGGVRRGAGYEGRVSMSHEAYGEGDMSLDLTPAQTEDAADYFCSVLTKETREEEFVGAVRLTVNKKILNDTNAATQPPTQICPEDKSLGPGTIIILIFVFIVAIVLAILLGWWLKSRCFNGSSVHQPGGESEPLNTAQPPHPPQSNGCPPLKSQEEETAVRGHTLKVNMLEIQHCFY